MVLTTEVFDFSIMVLVLLSEGVDDLTLCFDLSLQVLVGLLDQEDLLLFLLLLFQELFFASLLGLKFFLELSVFSACSFSFSARALPPETSFDLRSARTFSSFNF